MLANSPAAARSNLPAASPNLRGRDPYDAAVDKFNFQSSVSNPEFWRRIGAADFSGCRVMDFGSGLGALSVDIARRGAREVVAVDIDQGRLDFARKHIALAHPEVADRISFRNPDRGRVVGPFDCIVAKDAFEHVDDVAGTLANMHALLRPGGLLLTGFGPLYFSPFGDHGRFLGRLPWLPVLLPESMLLAIARRRWRQHIESVQDLGLNKLSPREFRELIRPDCWDVVMVEYNQRIRHAGRLFDWLRRRAALEKYFTVNIYAQLRRR